MFVYLLFVTARWCCWQEELLGMKQRIRVVVVENEKLHGEIKSKLVEDTLKDYTLLDGTVMGFHNDGSGLKFHCGDKCRHDRRTQFSSLYSLLGEFRATQRRQSSKNSFHTSSYCLSTSRGTQVEERTGRLVWLWSPNLPYWVQQLTAFVRVDAFFYYPSFDIFKWLESNVDS